MIAAMLVPFRGFPMCSVHHKMQQWPHLSEWAFRWHSHGHQAMRPMVAVRSRSEHANRFVGVSTSLSDRFVPFVAEFWELCIWLVVERMGNYLLARRWYKSLLFSIASHVCVDLLWIEYRTRINFICANVDLWISFRRICLIELIFSTFWSTFCRNDYFWRVVFFIVIIRTTWE